MSEPTFWYGINFHKLNASIFILFTNPFIFIALDVTTVRARTTIAQWVSGWVKWAGNILFYYCIRDQILARIRRNDTFAWNFVGAERLSAIRICAKMSKWTSLSITFDILQQQSTSNYHHNVALEMSMPLFVPSVGALNNVRYWFAYNQRQESNLINLPTMHSKHVRFLNNPGWKLRTCTSRQYVRSRFSLGSD